MAGIAGVPELDQRGEARVVGGRIDIGAYEWNSQYVVDTPNDESDGNYSLGDLSLREAIQFANADSHADVIVFDESIGRRDCAHGRSTGVSTDVTIKATGADLMTIDASGNDPTPTSSSRRRWRVSHRR